MKRAALCVGVNRYHDPGINGLEYAEADATELYGFFKRSAGYDEVRHLLAPEADQVLDCAREMAAGLEPGDLFVFFFAGHGYEFQGRHLLLCPKARLSRLQFFHQIVPVDLLKEETQQVGVDRVFVLDACRTDLLKDRGGAGGLRGAQGLRDIVAAPVSVQGGAFTLLCGCDEGQQSREMPELKQGLFSRALLEEFEAAAQARAELRLDDRWESELCGRIGRLAARYGMPTNQRPWIKRSGGVPVLLTGRAVAVAEARPNLSPPEPVTPPVTRVKCPACGLRNDSEETFECRVCGRDHLCRDHFVKAERCCKECADKLASKRATAERRARGEAEHQANSWPQAGEAAQRRRNPRCASKDAPWENSLGMKFVPVPDTSFLVSVWPTRVEDYQAFAEATGRRWAKPDFKQGPAHPAMNVTWKDAHAFCKWLTMKERWQGLLKRGQSYRLPEWREMIELADVKGGPRWKPKNRDGIAEFYWLPFSWKEKRARGTSPVGSYGPSKHGVYDLGGYVFEWCNDSRHYFGHTVLGPHWAISESKHTPEPVEPTLFENENDDICSERIRFRCVLVLRTVQRRITHDAK